MGHEGDAGPALEGLLSEIEPMEPGLGAGVAVFQDGKCLGEAWIGEAAMGRAWEKSTPVLTWSVSKGIVSMIVARLAEAGAVALDAPIHEYWPEFGGARGDPTTLEDVMTHRAGRAWLRAGKGLPSFGDLSSFSNVAEIEEALASMPPLDDLRGQIAYHALTFGWLVEGCLRRATGKGLRTHLEELVGLIDDVEMDFGTRSPEIMGRMAVPAIPAIAQQKAASVDEAFSQVDNGLRKSLCVPPGLCFAKVLQATKEAEFLAAETPAMSLVTDAHSLAKTYSLFAAADRLDDAALVGPPGLEIALRRRHETNEDAITGGSRSMALGFVLNSEPSIRLSPGPRTFGHPGMGGSLAWGDPELGLGFAYVTNASIPDTVTDARAAKISEWSWRAAAGHG